MNYIALEYKRNGTPFQLFTEVKSMPADSWASDLRIMQQDSERGEQSGRRCLKVEGGRIEYIDGGSATFLREEAGRVFYTRVSVVLTKQCPYCKRKHQVDNDFFAGNGCRKPKCILQAMRDSI